MILRARLLSLPRASLASLTRTRLRSPHPRLFPSPWASPRFLSTSKKKRKRPKQAQKRRRKNAAAAAAGAAASSPGDGTSGEASPSTTTVLFSRSPSSMRIIGVASLFQSYTSAALIIGTWYNQGLATLTDGVTLVGDISVDVEALSANPWAFTLSFSAFSVMLTSGVWHHNRRAVTEVSLIGGQQGDQVVAMQYRAMGMMAPNVAKRVPLHRIEGQPPLPAGKMILPIAIEGDATYFADLASGTAHDKPRLHDLSEGKVVAKLQ